MILALTGATGFVGGRTLDAALAAGHSVRALTRRPQPPRDGITWIEGSLTDDAALGRLMDGADAAVHIAGVVNAPDRAGFVAGNIDGTRAMLAAATNGGVARFVHVSSLSAREPDLSIYGWSKAGADKLVMASDRDWTIVRPPAVYGPGDREMLDVYRMAARGVAILPPAGRFSVVEVGDLARLLVALAETDIGRRIVEPDDGTPGGWSHDGYARAIGEALGRRVRTLHLPRPLMLAAGRADRALRGGRAKLTPDRAAYLSHPDWTVDPANRPPDTLWRAEVPTRAGLAATAAWYRAAGLL